VCTSDLFGGAAEEKEVAQIAGKTSEARSHKSFDTLHLIAKYVSEKSVTDILIPIKDVRLFLTLVLWHLIECTSFRFWRPLTATRW